jgi:hypothetical protein
MPTRKANDGLGGHITEWESWDRNRESGIGKFRRDHTQERKGKGHAMQVRNRNPGPGTPRATYVCRLGTYPDDSGANPRDGPRNDPQLRHG